MRVTWLPISDEDRVGVARFLHAQCPRAKEGDTYVVRQRYGGRWRMGELGWEPEHEFQTRQRVMKEVLKNCSAIDEARALAAGKREQAIYDATPSWEDLQREIPGFTVIENPDGTKTAEFRDTTLDQRYKKRIEEMYGEVRELELEKSEDFSERQDWHDIGTAYHPNLVPGKHADRKAKKIRDGR